MLRILGADPDHTVHKLLDYTGRGGDAALLNAYLDYQDVQLQVTHGFGVRNVNERLMLRFGQRGGLRYFNYDGRQLLARLTLPSECDAASDTWP